MMGAVALHFSSRDDGVRREMLCLNVNFAFKAPVFAEQDIVIAWRVDEVGHSQRQGGYIGHLDGRAVVAARSCVVGRSTILIKRATSSSTAVPDASPGRSSGWPPATGPAPAAGGR